MAVAETRRPARTPAGASKMQRDLVLKAAITSLGLVILLLYLMPLGYSILTSLKSKGQVADPNASILPAAATRFEYEGETYDVYQVPTDEGVRDLALVQKGRSESTFVDPQNPEAGEIAWEGRWRTLSPASKLAFQWSNYPAAFRFIDFLRLLAMTLMYAGVTTVGATFSAAIIAYGFARFRFPFKNVLFIILISTIILPPQVTLVPTYAFFYRIGWVGTWLPLIVPQFFRTPTTCFCCANTF